MSQAVQKVLNLTLPFWSSHKRGAPNALARSALFGVGEIKRKREHFEQVDIPTYGGHSRITYTGAELRQDDCDLFLQLIHMQRETSFEAGVEFLTTPMLKTLGRSQNSIYINKMKRSLERMVATALTVEEFDEEGRSIGYCGSLIQRFSWKDEAGNPSRRWRVWFDPKIVALFDWASYSLIDWETRIRLKPLAKWLHLHYSTHKNPLRMKCSSVMQICGSRMKNEFHFKQELKRASDELVRVGFLDGWNIDPKTGNYSVVKASKRAQK